MHDDGRNQQEFKHVLKKKKLQTFLDIRMTTVKKFEVICFLMFLPKDS